jgi:xylan 1,4-beta-xylosidase
MKIMRNNRGSAERDVSIFSLATGASVVLCAAVLIFAGVRQGFGAVNPLKGTFCNPVNIDYNFWGNYREAADPAIITFNNEYYLFASHSGGYWWSTDMNDWKFVKPTGIDINKYAPAPMIIGNTMYYTSSESGYIYKTTDPKGGQWTQVSRPHDFQDPGLFADDDGKVYCYHNCSANGTIDAVQLDPANNFAVIGTEAKCILSNRQGHGFEVPGDNNENTGNDSWIEGAWMTKYKGTYYLQYAVPGTQWRSYSDGCYTSSSAVGPFTFCQQSPISARHLGFVTGAGHSATFTDLAGKYWHVTTVTISVLHMFERRVAIFPAGFDADNLMHTDTYLGDYPQYLPGQRPAGLENNRAPCMLVSFKKAASASSTLTGRSASNAFDEDIRTMWSATSSNAGEWLKVDLGKTCEVAAIQTNFGEQDVTYGGGRGTPFSHKYKIEGANDTSGAWTMIMDKTANTKDVPHDYVVLDSVVNFRFIRITNAGPMPGDGKFAIRDFRVFGSDKSSLPQKVNDFSVSRSASDTRTVTLSWGAVPDADGYIIRFGTAPGKLYNNYQIMGNSTISYTLRSLNVGVQYFYSIDSYNAGGVTNGTLIKNDNNITATVDEHAATRSQASSGRIYRMFGQLSVPQEFLHKSCAISVYDCSGKLLASTALSHGRMNLPHDFSNAAKVYLVRVTSVP